MSTPGRAAPETGAGDEMRRKLLDGCERSIEALRACEDAAARDLTIRLESLKSKLRRELRQRGAPGGDIE